MPFAVKIERSFQAVAIGLATSVVAMAPENTQFNKINFLGETQLSFSFVTG